MSRSPASRRSGIAALKCSRATTVSSGWSCSAVAYGVERAVQILEGHSREIDHPREKLALWTIVKSRWPLLAEYLGDHPDLIESITQGVVPAEVEAETERPYLARLFCDHEVRRVVCGDRLVGVQLDARSLKHFVSGPEPEEPVVHG